MMGKIRKNRLRNKKSLQILQDPLNIIHSVLLTGRRIASPDQSSEPQQQIANIFSFVDAETECEILDDLAVAGIADPITRPSLIQTSRVCLQEVAGQKLCQFQSNISVTKSNVITTNINSD